MPSGGVENFSCCFGLIFWIEIIYFNCWLVSIFWIRLSKILITTRTSNSVTSMTRMKWIFVLVFRMLKIMMWKIRGAESVCQFFERTIIRRAMDNYLPCSGQKHDNLNNQLRMNYEFDRSNRGIICEMGFYILAIASSMSISALIFKRWRNRCFVL